MQLIQTESFGQGLLSEGLFGEHGGDAVGTFLALWRVQQNEWLNLPQLFQELLPRIPFQAACAGLWRCCNSEMPSMQ